MEHAGAHHLQALYSSAAVSDELHISRYQLQYDFLITCPRTTRTGAPEHKTAITVRLRTRHKRPLGSATCGHHSFL